MITGIVTCIIGDDAWLEIVHPITKSTIVAACNAKTLADHGIHEGDEFSLEIPEDDGKAIYKRLEPTTVNKETIDKILAETKDIFL